MRKLIFIFILPTLFALITANSISAQTSCPTNKPNGGCSLYNPDPTRCVQMGACPGDVETFYCCSNIPDPNTNQPVTQDTEPTSGNGVLCQGTNEINTAIGCIPFDDPTKLTGFILRWAIGIAGGIAFLLIIYAGFLITTSQGDPKRLQAGRELLTSAIGGLMLLIFSVFILRVIGVDILQIPGLGTQ